MMKGKVLLFTIAIIPIISAWPFQDCPTLPPYSQSTISFNQLSGKWIIAAFKDNTNERCINITIENDDGYTLRKDYIGKLLHFWNKAYSKEYEIKTQLRTTVLETKLKEWYSYKTEKNTLIQSDYTTFAVFYHCSSFFKVSESYEVWTRDILLDSNQFPQAITDALASVNLTTSDLTFRTLKDCEL